MEQLNQTHHHFLKVCWSAFHTRIIHFKWENLKEGFYSYSFPLQLLAKLKTEVRNSIYQESYDIHSVQCIPNGKAINK